MDTIEQIPVADELFRWSDDGADLIGSRCRGCGAQYFPKSLSCRNPQCDEKAVEPVLLGRHGRLHSYTIQHYQPPGLFRMDPFTPYAIGLVELPGGLRVMGMLAGCGFDNLRIGMPVELSVDVLYRDEAGREVITYTYRPGPEGKAS